MLAAPDGLWTTGKSFTGTHTTTWNILNQGKLRLNQNMNRKGMHSQVLLCLCEIDPHLQVVPGPESEWLWCSSCLVPQMPLSSQSGPWGHAFLSMCSACLLTVPLLCLELFQFLPLPCSPAHLILYVWGGFLHQKGAWLLPGKEESLLFFKAKASFLLPAHARHFGKLVQGRWSPQLGWVQDLEEALCLPSSSNPLRSQPDVVCSCAPSSQAVTEWVCHTNKPSISGWSGTDVSHHQSNVPSLSCLLACVRCPLLTDWLGRLYVLVGQLAAAISSSVGPLIWCLLLILWCHLSNLTESG